MKNVLEGNSKSLSRSKEWLAALVCQQRFAVEELHLADNRVGAAGTRLRFISMPLGM